MFIFVLSTGHLLSLKSILRILLVDNSTFIRIFKTNTGMKIVLRKRVTSDFMQFVYLPKMFTTI
jgi:hypothetical protein